MESKVPLKNIRANPRTSNRWTCRAYVYKNHEVRVAAEAMNGASGFQQDYLSRNRMQHITNGAGGSNTIRMILGDISEICHLR